MSTQVLVDLACMLYEDTYGSTGSQVLRAVLERRRVSAREIFQITGLPKSAIQRTLISLITNRFVLFWQQGPRTSYFGNWWQVYSILWTGQLLGMESGQARDTLMQVAVDGPLFLPPDSSKYLRRLAEFDFWPAHELTDSLTEQQRKAVSNDPATVSLSEAAKKLQVQTRVQAEAARIRSLTVPDAPSVIDWDRFLISARTLELEQLSKRKIGAVTAKVYSVLLRLSERSCTSTRQRRIPGQDTTVTAQQISLALQRELTKQALEDLASAFVTVSGDIQEPATKKARSNGSVQFSKAFDLGAVVNRHLALLQECISAKLVLKTGDRGGGEWFVPFEDACSALKRDVFDSIVSHSFGTSAARLLRIIRSTGKLDEKMLAHQALLPAAEVRQHMSLLSECGFVDIQELARPNDRGSGPSAGQKRSMYLWCHNPDWAYKQLVSQLYARQIDILNARRKLRAEHSTLIMKISRVDVASEPDQYLTANEKMELNSLRDEEKKLLQKLSLLDRHVRIFREY